ncbi:MAG: PAS domain S-box protein [Arthrospira sp. PLM2.Bin9]|nr:MAG: PAS domain S-box protein [Arthrospira sp. PLM2.Bin9]
MLELLVYVLINLLSYEPHRLMVRGHGFLPKALSNWLHLWLTAAIALVSYCGATMLNNSLSIYGDRCQFSTPNQPFWRGGGNFIGNSGLLSLGLVMAGNFQILDTEIPWYPVGGIFVVAILAILGLLATSLILFWLWWFQIPMLGFIRRHNLASSLDNSATNNSPNSINNNPLTIKVNANINNWSAEDTLSLTQFSIDKAADAIFWIGIEGQIIYVNESASRLLGYSPKELLLLTIHDINPDFPRDSWHLHWQILRRCGSLKIEARYRTKHSRLIPVEMMINHLNFKGEEYQCVFIRDISDRKQVERMLRERQGEFRTLVSNIPGAVYRSNLDIDRTMTFMSPGVESITGYSPNDLILNRQISFASLIHPDDKQRVIDAIHTSVEKRNPYILEYRLLRADGSQRWVYDKGQGIFDDDQQVLCLAGAIFDITKQKQASEALRINEERLQLALTGTNQGLWDWNLATDEVYFSPQWGQMLGYDMEHINTHARSWLKLVHPQDRHQVIYCLKQHWHNLTTFCEVEHRMFTHNGGWKWVLNHGQVVSRDEQGKPLRMTGTVRDISDRKQAEDALRQSEARERARALQLELTLKKLRQAQSQLIQNEKLSSLGQMVAGIAHEINNPVTFIYGNISYASQYVQDLLALIRLYQRYYPQPAAEISDRIEEVELGFIIEDLPRILESMEVGANRIRQIVLSLRNFARLDESEMKPVNIHEGIESTLLILQHRLKGRLPTLEKHEFPEIKVVRNYGDLPKVECYAGQLNQVFLSILSNAIDAILEVEKLENGLVDFEPTIQISTALINSDWVSIKISDNGLGMEEEVLQRLFEPFFTTKPVGRGTGLGLAMSYQIVAKHGGNLTCRSVRNKGSEFAIEIPRRPSGLSKTGRYYLQSEQFSKTEHEPDSLQAEGGLN